MIAERRVKGTPLGPQTGCDVYDDNRRMEAHERNICEKGVIVSGYRTDPDTQSEIAPRLSTIDTRFQQ